MRIEKNDRKKIFGIALVILMLVIVGIFVSGDRKGTHETEAPPNGFSVYYIIFYGYNIKVVWKENRRRQQEINRWNGGLYVFAKGLFPGFNCF